MKELILIEYFTALQNLALFEKKTIFSEAMKLVDEISLNFIKSNKLNKIHVIRNNKLQRLKKKKLVYSLTSPEISLNKILNSFKNNVKIILIAPETGKVFINLFENLKKKGFTLLNSDLINIKNFSSKKKTFLELNKFLIPSLETKKISMLKNNVTFISKPDYGGGCEDIIVLKNHKKLRQKEKSTVLQEYSSGKKGSFSMLTLNGMSIVIACNKQLISFKGNKIKQIGIIVGGYENFRKIFENLANKISINFKGLKGFIGVDVIESENKWNVLEINSRFTSAYIGIESSYGKNAIDFITSFYVNENFNKNFKPNFLKETKFYF